MSDEIKTESRIRLGFKQLANGKVGLDVMSEADTVDLAINQLEDALPKFKATLNRNNFKSTDQA